MMVRSNGCPSVWCLASALLYAGCGGSVDTPSDSSTPPTADAGTRSAQDFDAGTPPRPLADASVDATDAGATPTVDAAVCDAGCTAPSVGGETHRFSGGLAHGCAITSGGAVSCWGWGTRGQLGNGNSQSSDSPVSVRDLDGIVDLQARDNTTCARNMAGEVWCWGQNESGETGDASGGNRNVPVRMEVPAAIALGIGLDHACIIDDSGSAVCWGSNAYGQLGRSSNNGANSPQAVDGLGGLVAIDAANDHTCALDRGGAMYCWGRNNRGQLGDGSTSSRNSPGEPIELESPVVEIALGRRTSCARLETGDVLCWGANDFGEVDGSSSADEVITPTRIQGLDGLDVVDINCGGHFGCALGSTGEVRCWGDSRAGQLGREVRTVSRAEQVSAVGLVDAIEGGGHHLCVGVTGEVRCLGKDDGGQLLGGGDRTSPVTIPL